VITANLKQPLPIGMTEEQFAQKMDIYEYNIAQALHQEFSEIFLITSVLCLVGAVIVLALKRRQST
jgi:hypothetical protein